MQSVLMAHLLMRYMNCGINGSCTTAMAPCTAWDVLFPSCANTAMTLASATLVSRGACQSYHFPNEPSVYLIHPLGEYKRRRFIRTLVNALALIYVDHSQHVERTEKSMPSFSMIMLQHVRANRCLPDDDWRTARPQWWPSSSVVDTLHQGLYSSCQC